MFRLKAAAKIDLETDPTFVTLIIGVIITLTTFNGTVGFFRGNTLMLKFFGWILVILFLLIFIGGIGNRIFYIAYESYYMSHSL